MRRNRHETHLIVPGLILSALILLAACTGQEPANSSAVSGTSTASLPSSSGTVLTETSAALTAAPLPTETPEPQYTFDLTKSAVAKPDHPLAYLANADGAVIFGGENSPYYVNGVFKKTNVDSMWSPMTNFSFHLTDAVSDYAYSMDKTSIVFLVEKDDITHPDLMYFDGTEAYTLSTCTGYFCISSDGSTVAYISDGSLFVWNYSTKESTRITDRGMDSFALSPQGKWISYTSDQDGFCYAAPVGGEAIKIGSSCQPIALTDDGSLVYYYEGSGNYGKLCVFSSGTAQILDELAAINRSGIVFNRDCTQIVFPINGTFYFSMNGGKPVPAAGGDVVDTNPKYYVDDSFVRLIKINGQMIAPYFVEDKNLCNLLFLNGTDFTFFDENLDVYTFPSDEFLEGYLSDGGTALLYSSYDKKNTNKFIYTFVSDFRDPECEKKILDDRYIRGALLTANDTVYYRNDIGQLFMIRGSDEPVKIDTYVYDLNTMTVGDSTYVYYLKDATEDFSYTLCRIEDVPGAQSVVIDKGVYDMDICDAGLVYYKNVHVIWADETTVDVYYADDGLHGENIFNLDRG